MKGHHNLEVWKRSIDFVTKIYKLTEGFAKSEIYGLVQQIRRSTVSIPGNIAEGAGRDSKNEYRQFLSIAQGSIAELDELSRMIVGLTRALKS